MYKLIYVFRQRQRVSKPIAAESFTAARENGKLVIPKRAELIAVRKTL